MFYCSFEILHIFWTEMHKQIYTNNILQEIIMDFSKYSRKFEILNLQSENLKLSYQPNKCFISKGSKAKNK